MNIIVFLNLYTYLVLYILYSKMEKAKRLNLSSLIILSPSSYLIQLGKIENSKK